MSTIKTLSGGYKENSPRVRSENSKKPFVETNIKMVDFQELANKIKGWYGDGKITTEGLQSLTTQLQEVCELQATSYQSSVSSLEEQVLTLDTQVTERQAQLDEIKQGEDIVATIEALTNFFGSETIEKIKNQSNV
jgi:hypothetical protein